MKGLHDDHLVFASPLVHRAMIVDDSLGYADPQIGLAYAYVTSRMGTIDGDPRDVALRRAIPAGLE